MSGAFLSVLAASASVAVLPGKWSSYRRTKATIDTGNIIKEQLRIRGIEKKRLEEHMKQCEVVSEQRIRAKVESGQSNCLGEYPYGCGEINFTRHYQSPKKSRPKAKQQPVAAAYEKVRQFVFSETDIPDKPWGWIFPGDINV